MAKKKKAEEYIYLYSKKVKISKLVNDFIVIPSFEIVKYLKNKEIYLPNYLHKALIRKNIAPAIADAESSGKFSDEMQYRLRWFDDFTIFQLERLASGYQLKIDVNEYKKDFWDIVIRNRTELGINNFEFVKLQNLTLKYAKQPQETYEEMIANFNEVYFEPDGYFDGTLIEDAQEVLENATTMTEIRDLGKKYGVDIPRRINKKQLVDIVALKLGFDDEKREEISKKSILEIERYAKRRKVNVSIELRKSDMIEYILIKMPKQAEPKYTESLEVFAGMNIEEYLYNIKFQEIAGKVKEQRKKIFKKVILLILAVGILGVVGYLAYTNFI
ncbi:MAG: hypothetical protein K9L26_04860 [Candidatus Izimaplasma sp.]|nr:hypothetical protein [Candidatus Izimaplasma bacterium]